MRAKTAAGLARDMQLMESSTGVDASLQPAAAAAVEASSQQARATACTVSVLPAAQRPHL
jgi:hypothetical protein